MKNIPNTFNQDYLANESAMIRRLLDSLVDYDSVATYHRAYSLVSAIRDNKDQQTLVEGFLHEYQLNSEEGLVLMEIAEALLRIPDHHTQDLFLQEKLTEANWHRHLQHSDSLLVNFATQALEITAKVENTFDLTATENQLIFSRLSSRIGLPVIRAALKQAMQQLAYQFVIAETIDKALIQSQAQAQTQADTLYSFDMLGEAALTVKDAERYFNSYALAIECLAKNATHDNPYQNPGISIKLSALYPRYEALQHKHAVQQISYKLLALAKKAQSANIIVTVDAEESERLQMSLNIFNIVIRDASLQGWSGLGLAVQAYQKRAFSILQWLISLAQSLHCKIPVRLVKGAYWDSEIKRAQINGLKDYPVFTHKVATDVCYLACSKLMLCYPDEIYPQFATHNAQTVAAILELGKKHSGYEFQRLHGMGEQLYSQILQQTHAAIPCRIYAPVGCYQDLLPYLVRRLLENGANTSFINQVENPEISIEKVIADPVNFLKKVGEPISQITLPKHQCSLINCTRGTNLATRELIKDCKDFPVIIAF